jgi:hypothetical protein
MESCVRRGCPEPAAFVPRLAFFSASRLHVPALSDPITALAHCHDCRRGIDTAVDLLGPDYLARVLEDFRRAGKVVPVRADVIWEPINES